jgi:2'-hydroxyisoflavone reductase
MEYLILGGTSFVGRHLVDAALARDHEVTVFNRGHTNPGLWVDVEELRGDREGDLGALEGHRWDAVVDTSGYVPRIVRASAELLRDAVQHYTFISSVSVYADFSRGPDETALEQLADAGSEDVEQHYGALKAACEYTVEEVFPDAALIIRPGLIVGPWDPTGRFTYWPSRIARGGDVLVPEPRSLRLQFIDARDLADWVVRMAEQRATGRYNATGPVARPTLEDLLEMCRRVANPEARLQWVATQFLTERDVEQWQELPLWIVGSEHAGIMDVDISKAVKAQLTFRPIEDTVRDTLEWSQAHPEWPNPDKQDIERPPAGLSPEREALLLTEWNQRAR